MRRLFAGRTEPINWVLCLCVWQGNTSGGLSPTKAYIIYASMVRPSHMHTTSPFILGNTHRFVHFDVHISLSLISTCCSFDTLWTCVCGPKCVCCAPQKYACVFAPHACYMQHFSAHRFWQLLLGIADCMQGVLCIIFRPSTRHTVICGVPCPAQVGRVRFFNSWCVGGL